MSQKDICVNTKNTAQNYGKMKRPYRRTLDKKNTTHQSFNEINYYTDTQYWY